MPTLPISVDDPVAICVFTPITWPAASKRAAGLPSLICASVWMTRSIGVSAGDSIVRCKALTIR